jgi:hypothetical protein
LMTAHSSFRLFCIRWGQRLVRGSLQICLHVWFLILCLWKKWEIAYQRDWQCETELDTYPRWGWHSPNISFDEWTVTTKSSHRWL